MRGGTWRGTIIGLVVVGLALAWLGAEVARLVGDDADAYTLDMAAAGVGALALWWVFVRLGRHFAELGRLSAHLAEAGGRGNPLEDWDGPADGEAGRVLQAAADALRRERRASGRGEAGVGTVLRVIAEPVAILAENGRIGFINPAAAALLGDAAAGRSVYEAIDRPDLFHAIERARGAGHPVAATLRRRDGVALDVRVADLGLRSGVALLFERTMPVAPLPPPATSARADRGRGPHLGDSEPLATLPLVALWVLATDADPEAGRAVAIGTVRLSGPRVFRTLSLDLLVDPGVPVPGPIVARHHLDPAAVAGARDFPAVWPVLAEALHGCALIGFEVETTLDLLRRERERSGLGPWRPASALDLGRLAAVVDPASAGGDIAALAAAFGVAPDPRNATFAPALDTAHLAAAVLTRLIDGGVTTHGQALAVAGVSPAPP